MRIRSIRPEFYTSEDIAALDWHARLVYIGLWSYVDDNGVGRDVEPLIVASLFPLDQDLSESSLRVHGALKSLQTGGQITRYKVGGKPYLHVTSWTDHQKINRPTEGRYPLPTSDNAEPHGALTEPSVSAHVNAPLGEGEKGRRGEGEKVSAPKRATPLPDSWTPTEEHLEYGKTHSIDISFEAEKFRNHCHAKGATYKNHNAAFANWIRQPWVPKSTTQQSAIPEWMARG